MLPSCCKMDNPNTLEYARALDRDDPLGHFRHEFAIQDPSMVYLDGNSLGRLPLKTVDYMDRAISKQWGEKLIITGTLDLNIENEFQVYPNPAKNEIFISNPLNIKINIIEIIDLSGCVAQKWYDPEPGENRLKIESVVPGVYLLRMETENGIKTEKLAVQ